MAIYLPSWSAMPARIIEIRTPSSDIGSSAAS
jgi:hypothetical protein